MKNMNDIREMLCRTMDKLEAEKTTPAKANGVANLAGKFIGTIKIEIEAAKFTGRIPNLKFLNMKTATPRLENKKI